MHLQHLFHVVSSDFGIQMHISNITVVSKQRPKADNLNIISHASAHAIHRN